jgi:hypothetical protein
MGYAVKKLLTSFDSIFALGGIGLTFSNKNRTVVHGLVIDGDALLAVMGIGDYPLHVDDGRSRRHTLGSPSRRGTQKSHRSIFPLQERVQARQQMEATFSIMHHCCHWDLCTTCSSQCEHHRDP